MAASASAARNRPSRCSSPVCSASRSASASVAAPVGWPRRVWTRPSVVNATTCVNGEQVRAAQEVSRAASNRRVPLVLICRATVLVASRVHKR